MKAEIKKQRFVQMRIEGSSFEDIAKTLSLPKATLIEWNKEQQTRTAIKEGLAIQLNDAVRALEMGKLSRVVSMLTIYKKVIQEIEKRDLTDVSTDKLIQLAVLMNQKLNDQNRYEEIGSSGLISIDFGNYFELETLG